MARRLLTVVPVEAIKGKGRGKTIRASQCNY